MAESMNLMARMMRFEETVKRLGESSVIQDEDLDGLVADANELFVPSVAKAVEVLVNLVKNRK